MRSRASMGATSCPWVLLSVHHNIRELEAKCFLASVLASKGIGVLLGPTRAVQNVANFAPPSVVIDVTASPTREKVFSDLKANGHVTMAFDEEAIAYNRSPVFRRIRLSPAALASLDVFFAWGAKHADAVDYVAQSPKALAVGHPRLDLFSSQLRPHHEQRRMQALARHGSHVLVVSHGGSQFSDDYIKHECKKLAQKRQLNSEDDVEWFRNYLVYQRQLHTSFVEHVAEVAARMPSTRFVYRGKWNERSPHGAWAKSTPSTRLNRNIYQDDSGTIAHRVMAASALIHANSAVAVEALLAGVTPIAHRPTQNASYDSELPNAVSISTQDSAEMVRELNTLLRSPYDLAGKREEMQDYLTISDSRFSAERISDAVLAQVGSPNGLKSFSVQALIAAVDKFHQSSPSAITRSTTTLGQCSWKTRQLILKTSLGICDYSRTKDARWARAPEYIASFSRLLKNDKMSCAQISSKPLFAVVPHK